MNAAAEVTFSKDEFLTELGRFRQLFGTKPFWAKPSADRQLAIKGLLHVYFNLDKEVKLDYVAVSLQAALTEYTIREGLMIKHGMAVGL